MEYIDLKLARKYQFARADFHIQLASVALLYYDYFLTLPHEIKYIWSAPRKLSSFFYFCCRYALIANLLWTFTKVGKEEVGLGAVRYHERGFSCDTISVVSGTFSLFGHIGILSVWGLRTHALCERNKYISGFLGLLGASIIALSLAKLAFIGHLMSKGVYAGCVDPGIIKTIGIILGVLVFTFEILAFTIASRHAWVSIRADAKFWSNPTQSLHYVVFSQGLLYLSAVLTLTTITAVCNLQVWGGYARPLNSLKLPLSCLLTARFLLHLRHWHAITVIAASRRSGSTRTDEALSAGHMSFSPARSKFDYGEAMIRSELTGTDMSFAPLSTRGGSALETSHVQQPEDAMDDNRGLRSQGRFRRLWRGRGDVVSELSGNVGPTSRHDAENVLREMDVESGDGRERGTSGGRRAIALDGVEMDDRSRGYTNAPCDPRRRALGSRKDEAVAA